MIFASTIDAVNCGILYRRSDTALTHSLQDLNLMSLVASPRDSIDSLVSHVGGSCR
jgi:hypothetical protein